MTKGHLDFDLQRPNATQLDAGGNIPGNKLYFTEEPVQRQLVRVFSTNERHTPMSLVAQDCCKHLHTIMYEVD